MKNIGAVSALLIFVSLAASYGQQTINPTQPANYFERPLSISPSLSTARTKKNLEIDTATPAATPAMTTNNYTAPTPKYTPVTPNSYNYTPVTPEASDKDVVVAGADKPLWRIRPLFGVGMVFDDNIYISNTGRVSDMISSVGGGLSFEAGDYQNLVENYLVARWIGTGYFFLENPSNDSFNQDASLSGQYRWHQLTAQLNSVYQDLTGPERQVGAFTTRQLIMNNLRFIYDYSDKTSFDTEVGQTTQLFETYLNQYLYYAKVGANYRLFPKIKVGLEGVGGILDVESSSTQSYEQINGRLVYSLTGKIDLLATGGIEFREFSDGDSLRTTPVFSLGLQYRPFDNTILSIVGYRNVNGSSATSNQNYIGTGFSLGVKQILFQKFELGAKFGYENDTYYGTSSGSSTDRVDNYVFSRFSVGYTFIKWMSAEMFYEFKNNASTFVSDTFYDNRTGFQVNAKF